MRSRRRSCIGSHAVSAGPRITAFGATGRVGVPLVQRALDRGHEAAAFTRSPERPGVGRRLTIVTADRSHDSLYDLKLAVCLFIVDFWTRIRE
ncbi:MAG: NAD(P)H-binding protein [Haloglomus sp.]